MGVNKRRGGSGLLRGVCPGIFLRLKPGWKSYGIWQIGPGLQERTCAPLNLGKGCEEGGRGEREGGQDAEGCRGWYWFSDDEEERGGKVELREKQAALKKTRKGARRGGLIAGLFFFFRPSHSFTRLPYFLPPRSPSAREAR